MRSPWRSPGIPIVLLGTHPGGTMGLTEVLTRIQMDNGIPVVLVADSDDDILALHEGSAFPVRLPGLPFGPRAFRQVVEATVYRHSLERGNGGKKIIRADGAKGCSRYQQLALFGAGKYPGCTPVPDPRKKPVPAP